MDSTFFLIAGAFMAVSVLLFFAFSGPNPEKALQRRVTALRDRLVPSNEAALAAQMRKTIATRLPTQDLGLAKLLPNPEKLALRLKQTGKKWTLARYMAICVGMSAVLAVVFITLGAPILMAVLLGLFVGLGLPHMFVGKLIAKRIKLFNARFPDAIDLLVRGLRSGLPIAETLAAVSTEVPGPVGVEFKQVIERIRIGKSMEQALQDSADTLGTPEFQFFVITLAIQRETGGNLAETLANLSEVLRKRAQMKLKIKAMSSEAKASAWIVGALPFLVFILVTVMNPSYTAAFFPWTGPLYDQRVMVTGIGGLIWMGIGVFIMAKMVDFEI
ncbi:MAG: type II secretion system F family protein [Sphingopyxis sp.]